MPNTLFIDGQWVSAQDGRTREIRNPADDTLVAVVDEASPADTELAIAAARRAFDSGVWSSVPASERGDFLLRFASVLRERKEEFAVAESLDTGKRIIESRIDMDDIANCFDYFGKLAANDAGRIVDAGSDASSAASRMSPSACARSSPPGTTRCCRPREDRPVSGRGQHLRPQAGRTHPAHRDHDDAVMEELGLPAGVATSSLGAGADAGAPLSTSEDVDMVSFTGGSSPDVSSPPTPPRP